MLIVPEVRWRRFRYEVREEEIDLLRGVVTITRTLVPMQRVQHVDIQRGALERLLGFSSVDLPHGRRRHPHPRAAPRRGRGCARPHRDADPDAG